MADSTLTLGLVVAYHERFSRRPIGRPYYAGLPSTGYQEQVCQLAPGATRELDAPPGGDFVSVVVAAQADVTITIGFRGSFGTCEMPLRELCVFTPPGNSTVYVRNDGTTGASVPVRILCTY